MQKKLEDMKDQFTEDIANIYSELNLKINKDELEQFESKIITITMFRNYV